MAGGYVWQGACMHGKGGCAWQWGMHGGGHVCMARGGVHSTVGCAWQGGMHGRGDVWRGACVAGGHVWQEGVHGGGGVAGGVHGKGVCMAGGHAWQGACHACPAADTTATAYGQ